MAHAGQQSISCYASLFADNVCLQANRKTPNQSYNKQEHILICYNSNLGTDIFSLDENQTIHSVSGQSKSWGL